jgi:hypothetical protein
MGQRLAGAGLDRAKDGFDLAPHLLDRIKVRRVRGKEYYRCAYRLDPGDRLRVLVVRNGPPGSDGGSMVSTPTVLDSQDLWVEL